MNTHQGFSLIEVLVALCLIGTTSYGLITQQVQITPLFQQITHCTNNLIDEVNQIENNVFQSIKVETRD